MVRLIQKSGYIKAGSASGYMKYIAPRPCVERNSEHGLFSNRSVSLDAALKEVEKHTGNMWTFIWPLRREDAARLGYDHAESWRKLIRAHQVEIAEAMKIPPDQLRWYAAFHDEGHHPHVHAMVWSADPKQGRLTKEGVKVIRSRLTNDIFQDEMYTLYQEKDISRKKLVIMSRRTMKELLEKMRPGPCGSSVIESKLLIPPKSNRKNPWNYDKKLYKPRNQVKRIFRRIFTRYDKLDIIFLTFVCFALIVDALM